MGRGLPRFTVRRLLVLVAIAAFVCGIGSEALRLVERRRAYREQVIRHTRLIAQLDRNFKAMSRMKAMAEQDRVTGVMDHLGIGRQSPSTKDRSSQEDARMTELTIRMQWHERMRDKYKRAAERPWLPVEPDPPGLR